MNQDDALLAELAAPVKQSRDKLYPGTVCLYQPAYGNWRFYFTGGMRQPSRWMFGEHDGKRTAPNPPAGWHRIGRGLYAANKL